MMLGIYLSGTGNAKHCIEKLMLWLQQKLTHKTKWRLSYASFLFSIDFGYCLAGCGGC